MDQTTYPVAVIGAGPVGLAAAANLHERRETGVWSLDRGAPVLVGDGGSGCG